jgi:ComF family protein
LETVRNKKRSSFLKGIYLIFDFIAPKTCLVCESKIDDNSHDFLCKTCHYDLPYVVDNLELLNRLIIKFGKENVHIDNINAMIDIKDKDEYLNIIHSFKYQGLRESAYEFGRMLGKKLLQDNFKDYDAIIPLPVHHARKRERGYNQSDLIAKGISEVMQIPYDTKLVKRKKYTLSQTKLNAEERAKNLSDAFKANSKAENGNYLIVDDVLTTGSTLNFCAFALKKAGAAKIDAAAIAAR